MLSAKTAYVYVVIALLVSGFDDIVSIVGMNLDDGPNNSIKEIKKYIDERKANYPQCLNPKLPSNVSFEFPPGHRIQIQAFIREVKSKHGTIKFVSESKGQSRKLGVGVELTATIIKKMFPMLQMN